MDMAHADHLHNHTPHIYGVMSPKEVWTGYKNSHGDLHNSHTQGYPAYVLKPRL